MTTVSKITNALNFIYRFQRKFPKYVYPVASFKRDYYHQSNTSRDSRRRQRILTFACGVGFGIGATLAFSRYIKNNNLFDGFLEKALSVKAAEIFSPGSGDANFTTPPSEPPSRNYNFIADVVEKTAPAVVFIEIIGSHPFVRQNIPISNGSGFIVESDGLILTNAHVVGDKKTVSVKLHNGKVYEGIVEFRDLKVDLATIRINATGLPTLPLGHMAKVRPGEWVVAMGSPLSLSNTITAGVISSVHRASKELGLSHTEMEYIQTDAAITFGNSGGPLVNLDGVVIGINTMKVTPGISFAIPADYVLNFLNEAKKRRKGDRSWWESKKEEKSERYYLGITMLALTPSIIQELQQRHSDFPDITEGVLVWKVMVESPAFSGGVRAGDIVTNIDGKKITSSQDIYKAVKTGKPLTLTVRRMRETLIFVVLPQSVDLD